ncbi:leucine rich adaptor protein 1 isoform X2 [Scleropages formosus]|uniref:Leucine rich adaptor protein 1 n=1 Tax=Scleropages formosus TaxID=113540 RepID=A0A8C9SBV6_SCLFO|nr:leucine rich adaptor protein 1 isoform X2 [Scleropages formosus]
MVPVAEWQQETMEEGAVSETLPDLKDLEVKLGRKTPDGLLRWMREEGAAHPAGDERSRERDADRDRERERAPCRNGLAEKIRELRGEMVYLRSVDVKILRQLMVVHEGIESVKWLLEERGTLTSRCSSLTSSQYSLAEGPDASLRGSWSSLQDPNDRLDNISIGSYLDTLADDLDEYCQSSSESVPCLTPFGKEVCGRSGGLSGSPLVKAERPKGEAPVWPKIGLEMSKVVEPMKAASSAKETTHTQAAMSNGFPVRGGEQGADQDKLSQNQSPKEKSHKNGKIDLESCKLNSKMHLEYDSHWHWVQSQDDVTFL